MKGLALPGQALHLIGGANRDRTGDLYNAIVALSQLSYGPRIERGGEIRNIEARRQAENSQLYAGFSVSAPPPRRFRSLRLPLPPRRPPHLRFRFRRRARPNRPARSPSRPSGRGAHVAI